MSPKDLPAAYLFKAEARLRALAVLRDADDHSDVVREAQEIVELCSKAILRLALIDPPHRRDVAAELRLARPAFDSTHHAAIETLARDNHWLRREREMAFYGADDFDPTEGYSREDADRAALAAERATALLRTLRS